MLHIIITVRTPSQAEDIENVLREGEENGDLDFAFGCRITERDVVVGETPQPVQGGGEVPDKYRRHKAGYIAAPEPAATEYEIDSP